MHSSQSNRSIPLQVKLRLYLNLWFQIGCGVFAWGMIFFIVFALNSDYQAFWQFNGPLEHSVGKAVLSAQTSMRVNNATVIKVTYTTEDDSGNVLTLTSYGYRLFEPGEVVDIEYPVGHREYARIVGMRRKPFHGALVFMGLLPFLSFIPWSIGVYFSRQLVHLLQSGELTNANLTYRTPTHIKINNRPVYKYDFDCYQLSPPVTASYRTHLAMPEVGSELIVLYDPARPAVIVPLEMAMKRVGANKDGDFNHSWWPVLLRLVMPIVLLTGLAVAYVVFF